MGIKTFGTMAVDWEERVNFDRLRSERLARVKSLLRASEMGALLCFDMTNVRYITATHIGTWAMDKLVRFSLLPRGESQSCGTSAPRRGTISSTAPGWASVRARASRSFAAPCHPSPARPMMWPEKSGSPSRSAACSARPSGWT